MKYFFVLLLVLVFSMPAFALCESPNQDKNTESFCKMDKNKDSLVNKEEFFAARPHMAEGAFDALDANKDGNLSFDEWVAFQKQHRSMKGMTSMPCPTKQDGATVAPPKTGK